jgi:hypothetical protein
MRHWYLKQRDPEREGGSRGGIHTRDGEDWALEIGQDQFANPDLFALAVLHDEVVEFLALCSQQSALAVDLHSRYLKLKAEVEDSLRKGKS